MDDKVTINDGIKAIIVIKRVIWVWRFLLDLVVFFSWFLKILRTLRDICPINKSIISKSAIKIEDIRDWLSNLVNWPVKIKKIKKLKKNEHKKSMKKIWFSFFKKFFFKNSNNVTLILNFNF